MCEKITNQQQQTHINFAMTVRQCAQCILLLACTVYMCLSAKQEETMSKFMQTATMGTFVNQAFLLLTRLRLRQISRFRLH